MTRRLCPWLILLLTLLFPRALIAQLPELGRIVGQIRISRGDFPPRQIMVELRLHEAPFNSTYSDEEGRFGFYNLPGNRYHVVVNDEAYYPVDERADVSPDVSPVTTVQIVLRPRENSKKDDPLGGRVSGANPYLVDPATYNKQFPKKAVKEYERALEAERKGKHDDAVAHYLDALRIAPDYYPAHNNLGALYLRDKDFKSAEEHFQEAVRLDQNDAQAYFNLANVFLLTGRYSQSETALAAGLRRSSDSAFAHFLEGCLFDRTGRLPEAEKSLRQALRLDPSMSQAHLQLVNLYLHQNRREDAIRQLQDFLKAFPGSPPSAKAQELLKRLQSEEGLSKR
jgi:tetratricopeptide (TPR) repeat protein